jgi:hypothetical protein
VFGCAVRERQRECVLFIDRSPNGTYLSIASKETEKMGLFAIADVVVNARCSRAGDAAEPGA